MTAQRAEHGAPPERAAPASSRGRGGPAAIGVLLAAACAILLLAAFALQLRRPAAGPRAGGPAPDFEIETFDGERVRLSALRPEVVVVNFWASWCIECVYEAPELEAIWQDYRDRGVTVLGVGYTDTRAAALTYLARHAVTYPNGRDAGGAISAAYRLTGVPETVVVDGSGRIVPLPTRGSPDPVGKLLGPIVPTGALTPTDLRAVLDGLIAAQDVP